MLQPKRSKYRKSQKMKIKGDAKRGHEWTSAV
jgi:ribosomal protein L16/L10AE